ncbi:MAG: hypothetical protein LAQ69_00335 [Acidobacteriia bacterium]|nr:hypothetical protein [Terriglobia bacterium]
MTIDEGLIRDVFLRASPADLEQVLTAIEAYRICVTTLHKLERKPELRHQQEQVMECAESCERALVAYAATGCWKEFRYPPAWQTTDFEKAHLVLVIEW